MKRSRICCPRRWRLTKQPADCFNHSRFAEQRWKRFGRLVRDAHPDAHFTRLQIVKSNACGLHVDAENVGPPWALAISIVHLNRIHCGSTCLCISLAFIGQERAWPSTSHALCVIVPVLLPRLHWAGTRSCICIACIVRHRACASSSPPLGRNALDHLHHMHCATSCPCFLLAFIGQERARASASHALCVIVLVHLPRLHWAGTRSASCIACIVRHRARVSPRLHWAGTRSCIGISCIVPRNGCPDNIGGGRCPAPVLLGAPRQCLADGLRPVARNGWGRHVGAAAAVRAIAKGRDDVNPRNDARRERLAMCRWRRCTT